MIYYFAPLEGLTYPEYRIAHFHHFGGCSTYFAPFLATGGSGVYKTSFLKKHLPDSEYGLRLIPQILSNNPVKFLELANILYEMGFDEINLNAGCPCGTVFSKHKGSGMLLDLETLDSFFDYVFTHCHNIKISVKTRMGVNNTDEFPEILEIYNKYPLSELIIHARSKTDMYSPPVDLEGFSAAFSNAKFPVIFNGDIFSAADLSDVVSSIPELDHIMLGRGILSNPGLVQLIENGTGYSLDQFKDFHTCLINMYLQSGLTPNYVVERMKNLWAYNSILFENTGNLFKKLRKSKTLDEYLSCVNDLYNYSYFNSYAVFTSFSKL